MKGLGTRVRLVRDASLPSRRSVSRLVVRWLLATIAAIVGGAAAALAAIAAPMSAGGYDASAHAYVICFHHAYVTASTAACTPVRSSSETSVEHDESTQICVGSGADAFANSSRQR